MYTFVYTGKRVSTFPAGVTSIGRNAFNGSGLTSVTIPASVTSIERNAFNACNGLASVTFAGTIADDLRAKFYATDSANGTPGTYTATRASGDNTTVVWTKQ